MAFIYCGSEDCAKSELNLFQIAPTQTSIEKSICIEVPPLSAITEASPLNFFIAGNSIDYMDLNNMLLYLCCKIIKGDGTTLAWDAVVGLVNYPMASIFSQLDVTMGDRLISESNNCYPYRAFIEAVLNYSDDTLAMQFSPGLFFKDTPGQHEDTALDGKNLGVDVKIKLTHSKDAFCLMGDVAKGYNPHIVSASLFVKKVRVAPGVHLGHTEALLTTNAKYLVDRVEMKVFSIPAGSRVSNQENLFLGQLSKMLVLGFVDNDAFSGSYAKIPFHFKHYDINFVALYVDGEQIPTKPLQLDFKAGRCMREYMNLVQMAGKHMKNHVLLNDRVEFAQGYTLFAFDLSPNQECTNYYSLIKTGNLRAEKRFCEGFDGHRQYDRVCPDLSIFKWLP
ncbi:uncharacterized protein F54H12.2-like [Emydura macquarii macquarii]|uniref:uncharacterized protein F54H12.2-like n=1 Tax=Emydura macquarii macquarii TaxID=1129001 RepID=UPI00352A531A